MSVHKLMAVVLAVVFCSRCSDTPEITDRDAIVAEVSQRLTSLATAMEARDTDRVMEHYVQDSVFLFTVDDAVYQTFDSLRADVRRGYGMFDSVQMAWVDINIGVVTRDVAAVMATFDQRTIMTGGNPWNTTGIWNGVFVRTATGWKIARAHQETRPSLPRIPSNK